MKQARQINFDTQGDICCEFSRQSGTGYVTNKNQL